MMPDIAAMIIAMIEITMAIPPRVRDSETFSEEYMSRAMPDQPSIAAMTINNGTDFGTLAVIWRQTA